MAGLLKLRLIGTSDLHANILPYDYYRDKPDDTVGLAKAAALIAEARAEVANSLLFDNGDFLQGTPLGDWAARALVADPTAGHPMISVMNRLDYDAASLGNHEFNYGLDVLDAALAGARFPILSCNIFNPDGAPRYRPWVLLARRVQDDGGEFREIRIGIVGFTTPQIVQWNQSELAGRAMSEGIAETARRTIVELRQAGADIVIALCHSGISRGALRPGEENAAVALAAVGGIDAMIIGHQHLQLPGEDFRGVADVDADRGAISGVPTFMPGFWGSHIGVTDLEFDQEGGAWRIVSANVSLRPIYVRDGEKITSKAEPVGELVEIARAAHEKTLAYVREPVGELLAPIHSYFALIADDASVEIVNAAQLWYARAVVARTPALQGLPLLSASAPFKCGGRGGPDYFTRVDAGAIAIKNVADLYVYPNALRILKVSGATLRDWLERSALLFHRIDPRSSKPQILVDKATVSYDFDVIEGVTYKIDPTAPARFDDQGRIVAPDAHRIVDLAYEGAPVDETAQFLVVSNSYRASGGGSFPGCDGGSIVYEAPDTNREALNCYIAETSHIDPRPRATWRFVPWPAELTVVYETSPDAVFEPAPDGLKLTPMGPGENGFALFRVEIV